MVRCMPLMSPLPAANRSFSACQPERTSLIAMYALITMPTVFLEKPGTRIYISIWVMGLILGTGVGGGLIFQRQTDYW